ncbi:MAG: GNAT family N-acetyltransferase [Cyanobacteria bacterium P01_C01_bin.120]
MRIRYAEPADLPAVKGLVSCLLEHESKIRSTRCAIDEVHSGYFEEMLGRREIEDGGILIAEESSSVLGFLAYANALDDLEITPEQIDVTEIVVLPSARRQGIARALMTELVHLAQDAGTNRIVLNVLEGNLEALGFYESLGFQPMAQMLELQCDA